MPHCPPSHRRCPDLQHQQDLALNPGPDTRFRGNAGMVLRLNRENGVDINSETLPPNWTGERMDLNMAVCGLQDCE